MRREDLEVMMERLRIRKRMDEVPRMRQLLNQIENCAHDLATLLPDNPSMMDTLVSLLMTVHNLKNELEAYYEDLKREVQ